MAATVLTVQQISRTGLAAAFTAATVTEGDAFANTGDEHVEVVNGSGSGITVSIATPASVEGIAIADLSISVANGARTKIGPFPPNLFNDSNGRVIVICSVVTSVTIGAFKM